MQYVVGLCGTHGTGKSTILQDAKARGFKVNETQLSRAAQKALGWDALSRAQESAENMWALQNAILDAMDARDSLICDSKELTIVERTPADTLAYTLMWCNRLGIIATQDERAIAYDARCWEMSKRYADFIYIPTNDAIPFVADPHRADLQSRQFVAWQVSRWLDENILPYYKITSTSREDRAKEVEEVLNGRR